MNQRPGFIVPLESLRGLAALAVALFHSFHLLHVNGGRVFDATLWNVPPGDALLMRLIMVPFNGGAAVTLFFVLSGFVLTLSLDRSQGALPIKSAKFFLRRFLRIYPPMFVNLLLMAGVICLLAFIGWTDRFVTLNDLGRNLLLQDFQINGVTWTMPLELLAAPLLLANWFLGKCLGLVSQFVLLLLAFLMPFTPSLIAISPMAIFSCCFLLGAFVARIPLLPPGHPLLKILPAMEILALVVMLNSRFLLGYTTSWNLVLESVGSAILIGSIARYPTSLAYRFLAAPALCWLGRVSFSFYLYHPIPLLIVFAGLEKFIDPKALAAHPISFSVVIAILSVAAAIPLAAVAYRYIEKPTMRPVTWPSFVAVRK